MKVSDNRSYAIAGSKLISSILTFFFYGLLIKFLKSNDFVIFQVSLGIAAFLNWFLDFGLVNISILRNATANQKEMHEAWLLRTIIYIFSLTIILSAVFFGISSGILLIFMSLLIDFAYESGSSFRQNFYSIRSITTITIGKRTLILVAVIFLSKFEKISLTNIAVIMLAINIPLYVRDLYNLRKFGGKINFSLLHSSKKYWFQSGGTILANLDSLILKILSAENVIEVLALTRRISNALGLLGSSLVPDSMFRVSKDKNDISELKGTIFRISILTLAASIIVLISFPFIYYYFTEEKLATYFYPFVTVAILIVPLGVITANLNAVILALELTSIAAVSTYSSSISYLLFIVIGKMTDNLLVGITIGILMNSLIELVIQVVSLKNNKGKSE